MVAVVPRLLFLLYFAMFYIDVPVFDVVYCRWDGRVCTILSNLRFSAQTLGSLI